MPVRGQAPERVPTELRWIGTPQHFRWLSYILRAVLVLNLVDAIMTMAWIESGQATEANPLMADLVHHVPALFVLVKTALVGFGCLILWRRRKRPLAIVSSFIAFLLYYWIVLYHLHALDLRLLSRVITS